MARHFANDVTVENPVYASAQLAELNFYGCTFVWHVVSLPVAHVWVVRCARFDFAINVFTVVIEVFAWFHFHFKISLLTRHSTGRG
ncbi:MAG TPA: hypothetical protein PKW18_13110 [Candidatus Sumerlaeota bacterium]|nr:hypothetical protein [Candidatus Sumerlaeota bacterium]